MPKLRMVMYDQDGSVFCEITTRYGSGNGSRQCAENRKEAGMLLAQAAHLIISKGRPPRQEIDK